MAHILILEDDTSLATQLKILFSDQKHQVCLATTLKEAREQLEQTVFHLFLVDRQLPDGDGLDLVRELIDERGTVPCIILSRQADVVERIRGLRLGIIDYLPKPFSREELLLKVKTALRREGLETGQVLRHGELQFWPGNGRLLVRDQPCQLRRREAQLLTVLLRHPGKILSKSQLIEQVWYQQSDLPDEETIEVYIRRLRSRLPATHRDVVQTVRGYGYRVRAAESPKFG